MPSRSSRLFGALAALLPGQAFAAGFQLPALSTAGVSASSALVADTRELGALPYNPAAMGFHDGVRGAAELLAVRSTVSADIDGAGRVNDQANRWNLRPDLIVMGAIDRNWTAGIFVNVPFGIDGRWSAEAFPGFAAAGAAPLAPTDTRLRMININPNVAYRIDDNTRVAIGIDYYYIDQVKLDSAGTLLHGHGDGIGWNAAFLHRRGPLSMGVAYRSSVTGRVYGSVDATRLGVPLPVAASSGSTRVAFPGMLQAGVRYRVHERLELEVDLERVGWSRFGRLTVENGTTLGPLTSDNDWRDTITWHLGATYQLRQKTRVLAGYSYDPQAQQDSRFSARVPELAHHTFSVGVGQEIDRWTLELGYAYVRFLDRAYRSDVPFGAFGADPNGTAVFNGTYHTGIHAVGVGIGRRF